MSVVFRESNLLSPRYIKLTSQASGSIRINHSPPPPIIPPSVSPPSQNAYNFSAISTISEHNQQFIVRRYNKVDCLSNAQISHVKFRSSGVINNDVDDSKNEINQKEQLKKANLGSIIDELKVLIPNILNTSLPTHVLSKDILLRVCPTHFNEPYLPALKGHTTYYATCKALQLILTSFVLSPKVKLHVQSIRVHEGADALAVFNESTKIYVRWTTCAEGCDHLSSEEQSGTNNLKNDLFHSTSDAKLGSHKWSKLDTMRILNDSNKSQESNGGGSGSLSKNLPSITKALSQLPAALIGLTKVNNKLERVISGIFIFELNETNDEIIVHTVENVDIIERTETEDVDGQLRVC
ncbi:hypothetical protein DFJ63DRAFT_317862 [Scheffersomyces coipomensis]|uniref:uncharacterized protein n=1 Tax=Scheffersomyces coipomensis TaxID=1788519 RepID=UPI00315D7142